MGFKAFDIFRLALGAVRMNKLRSALTMLGIIIGIAAVITTVALGEGAKRAIQDRIEALGTDLLTIRPGSRSHAGVTTGEVDLTPEDAEAILERASSVIEVVPELRGSVQVELGSRNANLTVTGTTLNWMAVNRFQIDLGRFLEGPDLDGRRKVAVIGAAVLPHLGVDAWEILGRDIMLQGLRFRVIGVLHEKGGAGWFNPDEQVLIPMSTARLRIFGRDSLRSITAQVSAAGSINKAILEIEKTMRRQHRIREGQENDFRIYHRTSLMSTYEETGRTFAFLLAAIATVSLIVGGIGIMNVMLVSVTERTHEIGLCKALGATRNMVLSQFLTEAVVLCMVGGTLGVAAGIGASTLLARSAGWSTMVTGSSVLFAMSFSIVVGVFFGLYPAVRASRLDPIEALRYE
ncbi:MAG: ABC transporter permease [Acidobacteriota bacterium]